MEKHLAYLLTQIGHYATQQQISALEPDQAKITCCFCKRSVLLRLSFSHDPEYIIVRLKHLHRFKSPTCPTVLDLQGDNVPLADVERLKILDEIFLSPYAPCPQVGLRACGLEAFPCRIVEKFKPIISRSRAGTPNIANIFVESLNELEDRVMTVSAFREDRGI